MHFARVPTLIFASTLALVWLNARPVNGKPSTKACKYWCKNNEGEGYYCCPSGKKDEPSNGGWSNWLGMKGRPWVHLWSLLLHNSVPLADWIWLDERHFDDHTYGLHNEDTTGCPKIRAECPRSHEWYRPPEPCASDDDCGAGGQWLKCCFDVCLDHKTCKPAEWHV